MSERDNESFDLDDEFLSGPTEDGTDYDRLLAKGLAVRPVRGGIRITIRTNEEDERLLDALCSLHVV